MHTLQPDKEFMSLSIPASERDIKKLKQSLERDGCIEPILSWHGFILDGHKRYSICVAENIDFKVTEANYINRQYVIAGMCRRRLESSKRTSAIYKYLIGKLYYAVLDINYSRRPDGRNEITDLIANEFRINYITVLRYGAYSSGMERILNQIPALFNAVMKGEVVIHRDEMINMNTYSDQTFMRICRKYLDRDDVMMREHISYKPHIKKSYRCRKNENTALSVGVKEMPVSDPDRELRGLVLTVPMWISAISRAMSHTDVDNATTTVKVQLAESLKKLVEQVNITLEELK